MSHGPELLLDGSIRYAVSEANKQGAIFEGERIARKGDAEFPALLALIRRLDEAGLGHRPLPRAEAKPARGDSGG